MNESDQQIEVYDVNEDELLNRFGMDRRQIDDYQVLCLPENFPEAPSKDGLYDTRDSVNVCEQLRNAGLKSANSFDLNLNIHHRYFVRKSAFDLWLGTLFILTPLVREVVKGILIGLISASIYDYVKEKKQRGDTLSTSNVSFSPSSHLNLMVRKGNEVRILEYNGDSEAMISSLDKIVKEFFSTLK